MVAEFNEVIDTIEGKNFIHYAEHYNGVLYSSMLPDEGYFYTDSNNSLINTDIGRNEYDNE